MKWESTLLVLDERPREQYASICQEILTDCIHPVEVRFHLMINPGLINLGSIEITSFRSRPLNIKKSVLAVLSKDIFGTNDLEFSTADVLIAQRLSSDLNSKSIYLHKNDSYGSYGYIIFDAGKPLVWELNCWKGTDLRSKSQNVGKVLQSEEATIKRGVSFLPNKEFVESYDDLYDTFYGDNAYHFIYMLMEKRKLITPPREV